MKLLMKHGVSLIVLISLLLCMTARADHANFLDDDCDNDHGHHHHHHHHHHHDDDDDDDDGGRDDEWDFDLCHTGGGGGGEPYPLPQPIPFPRSSDVGNQPTVIYPPLTTTVTATRSGMMTNSATSMPDTANTGSSLLHNRLESLFSLSLLFPTILVGIVLATAAL